MQKVNAFMDNLEVLKSTYENKRKASNLLTRNNSIEVHSKFLLNTKYNIVKSAYEKQKWSKSKQFIYSLLAKDITILNNNRTIEKPVFRRIEKRLDNLIEYKNLLYKKIINPIALNSSYLIDFVHQQYYKYSKKHFLLIIDESKKDFLTNDILYKTFFNEGKKKQILHVYTDGENFSIINNNNYILSFELNSIKIDFFDLEQKEIFSKIEENPIFLKLLPAQKQTISLFKNLMEAGILDTINYNHKLYIKNSALKEEVDTLLSSNIQQEDNIVLLQK